MSNENTMSPVDAALRLSDYQKGKICRFTGPVEIAMLSLTEHLGHVPKGSDIMFILAAEVKRLRQVELQRDTLAPNCKKLLDKHEWRPIETAPRDGTLVLVRGEKPDEVEVAEWFQWNHSSKNTGDWTRRGCDAFDFDPTHWMPLPLAPGKEGGL